MSCLPAAMGDPGTAAHRSGDAPATLGRYAREAGFRSVEVLPLQTQAWRFYRLIPDPLGFPPAASQENVADLLRGTPRLNAPITRTVFGVSGQ